MKSQLSISATGHATSLLFSIIFILCVAFDIIFPELAMYKSWQNLLPGFEWISLGSFALGLIESYAYGWFVTLIWIPIYNFSCRKTV